MSDKDIEISKQARNPFFTIMNACRRREKNDNFQQRGLRYVISTERYRANG